jgi:hypothetical protein
VSTVYLADHGEGEFGHGNVNPLITTGLTGFGEDTVMLTSVPSRCATVIE